MRARRRPDLEPGAGARLALALGVVAIGGRLPEPPPSLAAAVAATTAEDEDGERAARRLARFAGLEDGTFVWTTDLDGGFRLGRLAGPWAYTDEPALRAVGLHHVRPTLWDPTSHDDDAAPAAVTATFARGGLNLQRIRDLDAERLTATLWDRRPR